jgi:5-deoxy-5-amino-3-dehydroquinate dehydratase
MTETLLLLNGPNLGILGEREPYVYGTQTLAEIERDLAADLAPLGWVLRSVQRNIEGELIDAIEQAHHDTVGAIVNPGALMIAGWALRDALAAYPRPFIEVHLSNIWTREEFRHNSVLAPLAAGFIAGLGPQGYRLAVPALAARVGEAAARANGSTAGTVAPAGAGWTPTTSG